MRVAAGVLVTWLIIGVRSATAGDCVPAGPLPNLNSETLNWKIVIPSGQTCLRGLRSGAMLIESVTINSPAKVGEVTVTGYGFSYTAPRGFKGEDSFSVTVIGTNRGFRGNSTLQVHVSVQ